MFPRIRGLKNLPLSSKFVREMGLLNDCLTPLSHEETMKYASHVRRHGIIQFMNLYHKVKDRKDDLKWGDEIEYVIVKFDDDKKQVKLSLRSREILEQLKKSDSKATKEINACWGPEYAAFMVEGTPGKPYGGLLAHFNVVEANMRKRREQVAQHLEIDEVLMCLTTFPRLGCENFTYPAATPTPNQGVTGSLFYPDDAIYQGHPRYFNTTNNVKMRRGEKPFINIPIYMDEKTKIPVDDSHVREKNALTDCVYLDAMGFGSGCCCFQVTFQASNISEARILYDQLSPFCPVMMALSAAAPFHRGFVTEIDCRWSILCHTSDCRTEEERGLKPLQKNKFVLEKSRYDSIDCYLSPQGEKYNDIPVRYHEEDYETLLGAGIDSLLARHVAHLFARDTISLFEENIHQNDEEDTDHFENIQSTNWQSMRFKPPPPNSDIGWRVEFRPCDVQITDFENAAFACFLVLLTRVILSYDLDFLIPISKVDENIHAAQKRNAVIDEKFWFRSDIWGDACKGKTENGNARGEELCLEKMTVNEIINGKEGKFPGIVPVINDYLRNMDVDADTRCTIQQYLKFIQGRASGEILTEASWMRKFVSEHPKYRYDSRLTEEINYDLLKTVRGIQEGTIACPELLGSNNESRTNDKIPSCLMKDLR